MRRMNDAMKKIMRNAMLTLTLALGMMALTTSTAQAGIPEEYGIPTGDGGYLVTYLVSGNNRFGNAEDWTFIEKPDLIRTINLIYKDGKVCNDNLFYSTFIDDLTPKTIESEVLDDNGSFAVPNGLLLYNYYMHLREHVYIKYDARLYAMETYLENGKRRWSFIDGLDKIEFIADRNGVLRPKIGKPENINTHYGLGWMVTDYVYSNTNEYDPEISKEYGYAWRLFTNLELTPVHPGFWGQLMNYMEYEEIQSGLAYSVYNSDSKDGLERKFCKSSRYDSNGNYDTNANVLFVAGQRNRCFIDFSKDGVKGFRLTGTISGDKVIFPNNQIAKVVSPDQGETDYGKYSRLPGYMTTVDATVENAGTKDAAVKYTSHSGDLIFDFDGRQLTNASCSFCLTREKGVVDGKEVYILPEVLTENPTEVRNLATECEPSLTPLHDLTGREVKSDNPTPGIYIRNGRKILVK